jgi:hypothetical protein
MAHDAQAAFERIQALTALPPVEMHCAADIRIAALILLALGNPDPETLIRVAALAANSKAEASPDWRRAYDLVAADLEDARTYVLRRPKGMVARSRSS